MVEMTLPALHPGQREVERDPARFKVVVCGRRWGKTRYAAAKAVQVAAEGKRVWWVGPEYKHTKIGWRIIRGLARQIPGVRILLSEKEARFPNGGSITVRTASKPDSLRSEGLDLVVLDEAAFMDQEVWHEALRPSLMDRRGSAIFVTTPNGFNWLYDEFAAASDRPDWAAWQRPTYDNPYIDQDEIDSLRATKSATTFAQEIMAEFVAREGRVFPDFSRDRHVRPVVVEPYLGVELGIDFGFRTFAFAACQVDKRDAVRWFAEAEWKNITTGSAIERLRQYDWADRVEFIACDPAGDAAQLQTGIGDVEVLRSAFPNARVTFSTTPQHRNPEWRAGRIRDRLWSASGQARAVVHPDCKGLIRMFELSQYPRITPGRGEKAEPIKDGVNDHLRDAVGYHEVCRFHAPRTTISARRPI